MRAHTPLAAQGATHHRNAARVQVETTVSNSVLRITGSWLGSSIGFGVMSSAIATNPYGALRCAALRCVALRCAALRCVALRCVALRCVALRCVALRCVALRLPVRRGTPCCCLLVSVAKSAS